MKSEQNELEIDQAWKTPATVTRQGGSFASESDASDSEDDPPFQTLDEFLAGTEEVPRADLKLYDRRVSVVGITSSEILTTTIEDRGNESIPPVELEHAITLTVLPDVVRLRVVICLEFEDISAVSQVSCQGHCTFRSATEYYGRFA